MIERMNELLWNGVVLTLILGTGVWISVRTGLVQLRLFPAAVREFGRRLVGRSSSFRALCTALAATVGTGNIAGVAGAIAIGGPGAVFWMWVSGILGMGLKFAEGTLAVRFREEDGRGGYLSGPMYIIRRGLGKRWQLLARLYAFFGLIAAFGVGNATQVNAVISALNVTGQTLGFGTGGIWVGILLAILVAFLVSGGGKAIQNAAEILIPVVSAVYILLCGAALAICRERAGEALNAIFLGAFCPEAVTGGAVGSFLTTLRIGVSRGTFTNEAGMGTAAIAHGTAEVEQPFRQGLMGIMEVFLDTMVICTLTALVILTSPVEIPFGTSAGADLTARALAAIFGPWSCALLCGCLCLFALATILGWGFYAGRCAEFLFGSVNWRWFALIQGGVVILGVLLETGTVWTLAEFVNGLMAIPNLAALLMLSRELRRLTPEGKLCYNRRHRKYTAR